MGESGLFSILYSINFQIRQHIATNQTTFSSIKPRTVVWVKISQKTTLIFHVWNLFTFFQVAKIMVSKYGLLMLPGVFLDELFEENFEFKWKTVATKLSYEFLFFYFSKIVYKILQTLLWCIISEPLM